MNIIRLACELFVIYLLFKLVFDFIVPVYRTTRQMKQKMNDLNNRVNKQQQEQFSTGTNSPKPTPQKDFSKDYIEFEEMK